MSLLLQLLDLWSKVVRDLWSPKGKGYLEPEKETPYCKPTQVYNGMTIYTIGVSKGLMENQGKGTRQRGVRLFTSKIGLS